MKKLMLVLASLLVLEGCQENEPANSDFTGNETVYALQAGSSYNISGTVTFKEMTNGNAAVVVALTGTEGDIQHPVHLHLGDLSAPGADVYALLNPVLGKTGQSETILTQLADETPASYKELIALEACMKIHLAASGPDRDIILAGANIGQSATKETITGRSAFTPCKSE